MTDKELLRRFEAATLTSDEFPHREHVRVAWVYLNERPLYEVLERFPKHLRKLADTLGATGLYHETVTWFFIMLVNDRMARQTTDATWSTFEAANPELFDRSSEIMNRHYEVETWRSERAKTHFLLPDRIEA